MSEKVLLYISVISASIGIISLSFLSFMIEPTQMKISEIGYDKLGKYSKITGKVISIYHHPDGHIFMEVSDKTESIKVVAFSDTVKRLKTHGKEIKELDNITVTGMVDEYKGNLEIIAEDVKDV